MEGVGWVCGELVWDDYNSLDMHLILDIDDIFVRNELSDGKYKIDL